MDHHHRNSMSNRPPAAANRLGADGQGRASSSQAGARASSGGAAGSMNDVRRMSLREANRIHCRATRERTRERERLLREEVELLTLCKAIVDSGPDLFSLHLVDIEAPFSFIGENYYERLHLTPEDVLGQPLGSIVDPRDQHALRAGVFQVLSQGGAGGDASGTLVNLRVSCGGQSYEASMTIALGREGLIVVTRLY